MINALVENIFLKRKSTTILLILASIVAFSLSISGHFYNETVLIYLFPFLLWKLRDECIDKSIVTKQFIVTLACGIVGGIASYFHFINIKTEIINHAFFKAVIVGCGIAVIAMYMVTFLENRWGKLHPLKSCKSVIDSVGGVFFVYSQALQGEILIPSPAAWVVAFVAYGIKRNRQERDKRTSYIIKIFSFIFACCMALGNLINISQILNSTSLLKEVLICIYGWYWIWEIFLNVVYGLLEKVKREENGHYPLKEYFGFSFLLIFIGFLPYFLAFYPGVLSSDSISQVQQVMGILPSSNHHPWIHTQLINVCYQVGMGIFGSANAGVAVYSIVSMLVLAFSFAAICTWQYKVGLSLTVRILSIIFLALCPFNGIYSITMWKDIPFTAFTILFMICILNVLDKERNNTKKDWFIYVILSVLVCVFRSNGIFVWLFTVPFLVWKMRNEWKKWILSSAAVLGIVFLYKGVLLSSLGVIEPDLIESLSIPAQQISCVIAKGGEVSEEAIVELGKVIEVDKIADTYEGGTSDPIKRLVRATGNMDYISDNPLVFAKIYIETGLDNIYYYIEAFIEQTKGYWHHKENDWIYHTSFITDNEIGIYRDGFLGNSIIKGMESVLDLCLNGFHVVWSLALFTYLIFFSIMISLIHKKSIVVYMPLIGLLLSLMIATPRYCDFRYVYLMFAALPLYLGYMVYSLNKK